MTVVAERPPAPPAPSPAPPRHGRSTAWWGMLLTITTEAMIFGGPLSSYFFIRATSKEWPPHGIEPPELGRIIFFTVILLGSSFPVIYAEHAIKKGNIRGLRIGLAMAFVAFGVQLDDASQQRIGLRPAAGEGDPFGGDARHPEGGGVFLDQLLVAHQHQRQIRQAVLADDRHARDFVSEGRARERRHGEKAGAEITAAHAFLPCAARIVARMERAQNPG